MATGTDTAVGAILEIPPQALNDILKAQRYIENLQITSKKAADAVSKHWGTTALTGLDAFIRKVEQANMKLGNLSNPKIDFSKINLSNVGAGASQSSSEISQLVQSISQLGTVLSKFRKEKGSTKIVETKETEYSKVTAELAKQTERYIQLSQAIALFNAKKKEETSYKERQTNAANIAELQSLQQSLPLLREKVALMEKARNIGLAAVNPDLQARRAKQELDAMNKMYAEEEKSSAKKAAQLEKDRQKEAEAARKSYEKQQQMYEKLFGKGGVADRQVRESLAQQKATILSTSQGAVDYAKNARSLRDLQNAYKNLKAVMSTLDPKSSVWQQMNTVLGQTKTQIDKIRTQMGELQSQSKRTGDVLSQLKGQLGAAFSIAAISGFIKKMVEVRAQFELQNVALRAILQNKDEADRIFQQVQNMAMQSPFTIMQLTTYTKQLAAYRIESEKLVGTTKMLADVSAGLGVDMQRLILAYGQVKSANYLRACLGRGTKVKMFDGSFKNVEDIIVGDVLMGDDEQPRNVSKLYQGEQQMYRVSYLGGAFRCNEHHILTVYDALKMRVSDVFVLDYLKEPYRYHGVKRIDGEYKTFIMKVEPDNIGTYYGFSIDGNHRFIIEDNVVTHNTEVRQFTEAGLNITGELANYFSELQGKMVSVGDVMEMITKRMVRFEDVDEVFKRVTSAGGLFYDMQKKQSESLFGQLQRIKDAYSIMMNDIGKSNQGAISAALQTIRFMISNWRTVANVMAGASAAMLVYTIRTTGAAISQGKFNAAQSGLVGALAKSKAALMKMASFLGKNPYLILITGIVAAGAALLDWKKKVDEARESYDNMIVGISGNESKLKNLSDRFNESGQKIAETQKAISNSKKGTEEYTKAVDANKEATIEQGRVLEELRNKFPEVYAEVKKTADETGDLSAAIENFAEVARRQKIIVTLQKDTEGWTNEGLKTDLEDLSKKQEEYNAALAKSEAQGNAVLAKIEAIYETQKATGVVNEDVAKAYERIVALKGQDLSQTDRLREIAKLQVDEYGRSINSLMGIFKDFRSAYGDALKIDQLGLQSNLNEAEKEVQSLFNNVLVSAGVTSAEMFEDLPDDTKRQTEIALNQFIKDLGLTLDDAQKELLNANLFVPLKLTPYWDMDEVPEELSYIKDKINAYIDQHSLGEIRVGKIKATDQTDEYFKTVRAQYDAAAKEIEQLENAQTQIAKEGNKERIRILKDEQKQREEFFKTFGIKYEKESSSRGRKGTDPWQKRLQLFNEINTEYEKLLQYYSEEEAKQKINESYAKAIAEIYKGQGKFADVKMWGDFDKAGMIKTGEELSNLLDKSSEKYKELQKILASMRAEVDIELRKEAIDNMKKQMQEVADNFELTETFSKLGVSTDLVFMLGGKPTTLEEYRQYLIDTYGDAYEVEKKYGKEGLKAYEDILRQIEQKDQKSLEERAKNYAKYIGKSYGESAKVMLDYYTKLTQMQKDFAKYEEQIKKDLANPETPQIDKDRLQGILDNLPEQAQRAASNMRTEMEKELAKINLEKVFKSPLFSEMFQTLGHLSNATLDRMLAQIRQIRDASENLNLSQLRRLSQAEEKIMAAKIDNGSLKDAVKYIKEAYELRSKGITLQKANDDFAVSQEELTRLEQLKDDVGFVLGLKEKSYAIDIDSKSLEIAGERQALSDQQVKLLTDQKYLQESINATTDDAMSKQLKLVEGSKQNVDAYKNAEDATKKLEKELNAAAEVGKEAGELLKSSFDLFGANISEADQEWVDFASNMLSTIVTLGIAFVALSVTINSAAGILGIIAMALSAITGLFSALFGAHDKRLEKQIRDTEKQVENLERAFEKLQKAIDNAFSFKGVVENTDKAIKNKQEQISKQYEIIRLNDEKKKRDQDAIDEARKKIEDLQDEMAELEKQKYEVFGGFGTEENIRSAAQEFADVWADGFMETGDGLDALKDKFDEFALNMLKKQVWGRLADNLITPILTSFDQAFDKDGNMDPEKWANLVNNLKEINLDAFNEQAKQLADALGFKGGKGELILSDLQKGIQNITEPQAAALEAYMNSIRFEVFHHSEQLERLIAAVSMQYGTGENPMVTELKGIRTVLDNIHSTIRGLIETRVGRGDCLRIV